MAVSVSIETITPALAEEWLRLNTANRRPRPGKIGQYAEDMKHGLWRLSGETIKFGYNGTEEERLLDGQNRLLAIRQSGATIESVVVRGLPYAEVMPVIDSGNARTLSDVLKLRGEKDHAGLASILSAYWRQANRVMGQANLNGSHQELTTVLSEHPEARDAASLTRSIRDKFPIRTAAFGAALMFGWDVDEKATTHFAEQVMHGEGLVRRQPAYMLRQWVVNAKNASRTPSPTVWVAVTNKALIAVLESRELGVLKWNSTEAFPYIQDTEVITAEAGAAA